MGYEMRDDTRARLHADAGVLAFSKNGTVVSEVVVGPPPFLLGLKAEVFDRKRPCW